MALSGLDIYKLLPKTNCKACGFATCLAFAMALAQKKTSLDKCPHITSQVRDALESASQPPVRLVSIGSGDSKFEVGNETVMFRHEQKFFNPAAIGFLVEDTVDASALEEKIGEINALSFDRAGVRMSVNLICIKNVSGAVEQFVSTIRKVSALSALTLALSASNPAAVAEALKLCAGKRPLIICELVSSLDAFIALAKEHKVPLAITCANLEEAATLTERAKSAGVVDLVINLSIRSLSDRVQQFTYARRMALKKIFRPLGYPLLAFTEAPEGEREFTEAVTCVLKYASIVIMRSTKKEVVFPLLVARQDVYADPQKPVQVEPRIYEIGKVTKDSPVLVTTNFSITYFTVAGEAEASRVPCYIICCSAEGMSVLTAWAAEKFTADTITDTLKKSGIESMVGHREVVIPGYVAVLSGKLEELSGWKVKIGPREASGLTVFLRNMKS